METDVLETHGPFYSEDDLARFCIDLGEPTIMFYADRDLVGESTLYKIDDTETPWVAYVPADWFQESGKARKFGNEGG